MGSDWVSVMTDLATRGVVVLPITLTRCLRHLPGL